MSQIKGRTDIKLLLHNMHGQNIFSVININMAVTVSHTNCMFSRTKYPCSPKLYHICISDSQQIELSKFELVGLQMRGDN